MIDIARYKEECYDVVGAIHCVKKELGAGLNEKIHQEGMAIELTESGIPFEREKTIHCVTDEILNSEGRRIRDKYLDPIYHRHD